MAWLSHAARRAVEEHMSLHGYQPQSEFFRKHFDDGVKEGREEGQKEALIKAIERLTKVFGITLSPEQRETFENAGVDRLDAIHEALCASRQWPTD